MEPAAKDAAGESPDAVQDVVNRVKQAVARVEKLADVNNASGNQNVTTVQNSDSKTAVWIMLVASALVLGMNLAQMGQISDLKTQVRRLEDYQNTTFMLVPELRKQVDERLKANKQKVGN